MNYLIEGRNFCFNCNNEAIICGFHVEVFIPSDKLPNKEQFATSFIEKNISRFPQISRTGKAEIGFLDVLMDNDKTDNNNLNFFWFKQKKRYEIWKSRYSEYKDSFFPPEK
jgi:hypothetical protein